jgi:ADP-ribose pyrophosphatase YjhB (NUDIX family)
MNYNNNNNNYINNNDYEKIITIKKNLYCTNCNKKGHIYKSCLEPVISNGIIGIYIENLKKENIDDLENFLSLNLNNCFKYKKLNNKPKNYSNNIKFLMIQRKNSLGYLEFMRGRYDVNNNQNINYIFEQMTQNEITDILNKEFDLLWNDLWDENNIKNKNHYKEYITSKQKFYELKLNKTDFLNNLKPKFSFNEWGFPKGRRELYESDIICAIREFEEETNIKENMYNLLESCNKIKENLIGTNGINYLHNYYLAILNSEKINNIDTKNREIGNIQFMSFEECIDTIRPYHINKIKIIKLLNELINEYLENNLITL